jgi:cytochrome c oxidase assembly factor CtaG
VISPGRMRAHSRMLLLFGAFIAAAPVSFALAFTQPAYDFYEHAPKLWGLSPLEDQQIGAVGMAIEQAVILFAACSIAFMQWLDEDEAPRRPVGFPT